MQSAFGSSLNLNTAEFLNWMPFFINVHFSLSLLEYSTNILAYVNFDFLNFSKKNNKLHNLSNLLSFFFSFKLSNLILQDKNE